MQKKFQYYTLIVKSDNGKWHEYATSWDKEILSNTMEKLIRKGYHRTDVAVVSKASAKLYISKG